jgi:hypothetical protein
MGLAPDTAMSNPRPVSEAALDRSARPARHHEVLRSPAEIPRDLTMPENLRDGVEHPWPLPRSRLVPREWPVFETPVPESRMNRRDRRGVVPMWGRRRTDDSSEKPCD